MNILKITLPLVGLCTSSAAVAPGSPQRQNSTSRKICIRISFQPNLKLFDYSLKICITIIQYDKTYKYFADNNILKISLIE
jgi:hypothetical protein